ncbi:hypothetical protein [Planktothricoides raciborskii]|uniref:Uncharacterized protein n=1 Tax=Planktothricoides raciborskii FACHB-1370 TaxID=2949576 RepID=A0ABR8EEU5_9CYAN|nr:hypothetical protein [Planktothricoides raciborskii]MBD2545198.1 hypothetical protein [Planktothricoides raciborskii FACHB-1370]MBD2583273.1 hypothetical protein [Planktothricoides raciborskii FACHB-1261]
MGSQKTLYRVKSTGQFVIQSGWSMRATRSEIQACTTYELLNQDYEPTGEMVQVSPDDLEKFSR